MVCNRILSKTPYAPIITGTAAFHIALKSNRRFFSERAILMSGEEHHRCSRCCELQFG
jgi:hypothetical protein